MATRNRVNPLGELILSDARGDWFGNRGVLHDSRGEIVRAYREIRWITCLLQFKGRRHPFLQPGYYTGLYFLDEATALAAGHRPCAECRRTAFNAYRAAWQAATGEPGRLPAPLLDRTLHDERLTAAGRKRTFVAPLASLPAGVMVLLDDPAQPYLRLADGLRPWTPAGYGALLCVDDRPVRVLTPSSSVAAIRHGYAPQIHATAQGDSAPLPPPGAK